MILSISRYNENGKVTQRLSISTNSFKEDLKCHIFKLIENPSFIGGSFLINNVTFMLFKRKDEFVCTFWKFGETLLCEPHLTKETLFPTSYLNLLMLINHGAEKNYNREVL